MKKKYIQADVSVILEVTDDEADSLFSLDENYRDYDTFKELMEKGSFILIPGSVIHPSYVEEFNKKYGTNYEIQNYEYDIE